MCETVDAKAVSAGGAAVLCLLKTQATSPSSRRVRARVRAVGVAETIRRAHTPLHDDAISDA